MTSPFLTKISTLFTQYNVALWGLQLLGHV